MLSIKRIETAEDIEDVTRFFRIYSDWGIEHFIRLGMTSPDDPRLATFNREKLPGKYNTARSFILIARQDAEAVGCVFLREMDQRHGEMKRFYVHPTARGNGVGYQLMRTLMEMAAQQGYEYLRISSHSRFMGAAVKMYERNGFYPIDEYLDDPLQSGDTHMEFDLSRIEAADHLWPALVHGYPSADIPLEGVHSKLIQAGDQQLVFMAFDRDLEVPEHAHCAQWGVVLEGEMQLTVEGNTQRLKKGDTYYIRQHQKHSARIRKGYRDLALFDEPNRYRPL